MNTLGLIVPCYNEQEVLELFYNETSKIISGLSEVFSCELIFVDDGSSDNTLSIIKNLALKDPAVKYISFSRNFGKEAAMLAGMSYAVKFDYIGIMDADLQHSPSLIPEMLSYVYSGEYDVAAARREDRAGEDKLKSKLSESFYKVINRVSEISLNESAQDFRIMSKKVVEAVLSLPENIRFSKGIFSWVGFNVKWIAHENRERAAGQTKWSIRKLFKYAFDGILGFTNSPLRLGFFCGAFFAVISLFALIYGIVRNSISPEYISSLPYILAAMFFIGAVMLVFMGVLGEYIGRIYTESKNRPKFVISETNTRQNIL
ncbi:MAG: glycosyltransferase family 2 protein [Oscillospiraceae bacterium]|nr:glycosyltransferase family 2 protein [Oscillospiraceae bacterium]